MLIYDLLGFHSGFLLPLFFTLHSWWKHNCPIRMDTTAAQWRELLYPSVLSPTLRYSVLHLTPRPPSRYILHCNLKLTTFFCMELWLSSTPAHWTSITFQMCSLLQQFTVEINWIWCVSNIFGQMCFLIILQGAIKHNTCYVHWEKH